MVVWAIILSIFSGFLGQEVYAHKVHSACESNSRNVPVDSFVDDLDSVMCKLTGRGEPTLVKGIRDENAYTIYQSQPNKFIVEYNPQFIIKGKQQSRNFQDYVNSCLQKYEPFLKGPNGEKLSIRATNNSKIDPISIDVLSSGMRAHAHGYNEDIDCPTVLHETLHILGLEDEYPEEVSGFIIDPITGEPEFVEEDADIVGYDCRAVTVPESVMYDQRAAILKVLSPMRSKQITCVCDGARGKRVCENLKTQKNQSKILSAKTCPRGLGSRAIIDEGFSPDDLANYLDLPMDIVKPAEEEDPPKLDFYPIDEGGVEAFAINPQLDGRSPPESKSLLMPAHFRAIVYPTCRSENKRYIECTEEAYQHSAIEECSLTAKGCQSDPNWLQ